MSSDDLVEGLDVGAYLRRIGIATPAVDLAPTAETLQLISRHHLTSIPFENLDLFAGIPVEVGHVDAPWRKIVVAGRGGWCHEHALVVDHVFRQLGYTCKLVTGQVNPHGRQTTPPGTHALVIVSGGGLGSHEYAVDLGFPDAALQSLRVDAAMHDVVQTSSTGREFRVSVERDEAAGQDWLNRWARAPGAEGEWAVSWRMPAGAEPDHALYVEGNVWVQHSEVSPFRRGLLITKPLEDGGRLTLSGLRIIRTSAPSPSDAGPPAKTTEEVARPEIVRMLRDEFGIDWPDLFERADAANAPSTASPIEGFCR